MLDSAPLLQFVRLVYLSQPSQLDRKDFLIGLACCVPFITYLCAHHAGFCFSTLCSLVYLPITLVYLSKGSGPCKYLLLQPKNLQKRLVGMTGVEPISVGLAATMLPLQSHFHVLMA